LQLYAFGRSMTDSKSVYRQEPTYRGRIFHTWKTCALPDGLERCVRSFALQNPHASMEFYDDQQCHEFVQREFPWFYETYLAYSPGILRADIWRVLVLYRYGGVYADVDVECLRPLNELLEAVGHDSWELLLTRDHPMHERNLFGGQAMWMNDFMIAKPRARFLKRAIDAFVAQGGGNHPPWAAVMRTGPGFFAQLVEEAGGPEEASITALPWEWIHPLPDMTNEFHQKAGYLQMIRARSWREAHDPFVVHYWHHTWCRSGNMLARWGHLLHQTDGETVERRLWRFSDVNETDPYPPHLPMTHAPFNSTDPRKQIPIRKVERREERKQSRCTNRPGDRRSLPRTA